MDKLTKSLFYYDLVTIVLGHGLQGMTRGGDILVRVFAYLRTICFSESSFAEISGFGL